MHPRLLFIVFLTFLSAASAQVVPDSLRQRLDVVSKINVDSLPNRLPHLPDSLLPAYYTIDSIRNDFNRTTDSLKNAYAESRQKIDDRINAVNKRIDSLQHLGLSTHKHTKALDSLSQVRKQVEGKFTSRLNVLKSNTTDKLQALDLPSEYKEPLQVLTEKVKAVDLHSGALKLPRLEIPGYSLPGLERIGDFDSALPGIEGVKDLSRLPDVQTSLDKVDGLDGIADQAKGYQQDLQNITDGNFDKVEKLPETVEQRASEIDGIDELQEQSGAIDEQKAILENMKDPEVVKEKAVTMAKKAAVDHFAGKEEQLKAAMEKVAKYKKKYSSVSSVKDLPKRPPNPMKGKPFFERLAPGLYLQYQQKTFYLLDVNPYVGYKLTPGFTTGFGWNHRYAYDRGRHTFNGRSRIFGPRAYVDFKLGKGFIAHLEGETMNTFVPSTLRGNPDSGTREWVWGMMTGIKKEFKIYKNLKGTALIQYNLFNRYYKAPYVDRLNSRIGFEYVLKNRGKSKEKGG